MNQLLHYIHSTDSTNNHISRLISAGEGLNNLYTVYTFYQTAGRGQAGNSWESGRGKNLLFSFLLKPDSLYAIDQFRLSMLIPLAVIHATEALLQEYHTILPARLSVKWPNDIYIGDHKLAGILIEHTLSGDMVNTSVAGVGVNVNQTEFISDAPNPVSLKQLTAHHYDLHRFMQIILKETQNLLPLLYEPNRLKQLYMNRLYRRDGFYPYVEHDVSVAPISIMRNTSSRQFLAKIHDITPNGMLCLMLQDGTIRQYHFKQVRFVIV